MLNDIYDSGSTFLKAADLQGAKPIVTISNAEIRENTYGDETKKQIVLSFEGKEKVLGLNFTNASRISQLLGTEDHDEWVGQSIRLYVDQTRLKDGRLVDCIRIFPDLPEQGSNQPVQKAKAKGASFSGEPDMPQSDFDDEPPF